MNSCEEKYTFIEKQVLAIVKALSKLKHYVVQSKILILTIHPNVKSYVMQGELGEGRPSWIAKILKYDVEIWPTKLIKGRALCEQLAKPKPSGEEIICFIKQGTSTLR